MVNYFSTFLFSQYKCVQKERCRYLKLLRLRDVLLIIFPFFTNKRYICTFTVSWKLSIPTQARFSQQFANPSFEIRETSSTRPETLVLSALRNSGCWKRPVGNPLVVVHALLHFVGRQSATRNRIGTRGGCSVVVLRHRIP